MLTRIMGLAWSKQKSHTQPPSFIHSDNVIGLSNYALNTALDNKQDVFTVHSEETNNRFSLIDGQFLNR